MCVARRRMRRSAAPSQVLGNAVKKPRFMPPGASTSCPVDESKPLTPKLGLGNALDKVKKKKVFLYTIFYLQSDHSVMF